ncbi:MAG TPA: hypothetical protein VN842_05610 [Thermoplasmata archaeon]|nr:hypothetical protein [Thermoplasmata archaeon]
MPIEPTRIVELRRMMGALEARARPLEAEGLPFPTPQIQQAFEKALATGAGSAAEQVIKRGDLLLTRVTEDWTWVKEILRRADELRGIAGKIGVDLGILDARVGNPRKRLLIETLSSGSLQKAAASASLALAVLNDAVPKFALQEAQQLGAAIRQARDRGEEVGEAAKSFSRLLQAAQDENLPTLAQRLVETQKSVAAIPRAPAVPQISENEEDEILLEARNLARRLQRIKGKARDARSAARLMSQVRAALSEDRRYGTPEEEIESLWLEVDRLTQEHRRAAEAPPGATRRSPDERRPIDVIPLGEQGRRAYPPMPPPIVDTGSPALVPANGEAVGDDRPGSRRGFGVSYIAPELPPLPDGLDDPSLPANRPRPRLRERP